jgi:TRAP-type mannitol/chloroaromatic compound transport system substrate-binding protein
MEEAYGAFNLVPRPAMADSPQMAGWFRKKIATTSDFRGLKMRIVNLGGKVYAKAGATTVLTPGSEIYAALERGVIDTAEWIGPHYDMLINLHQTARYYYYPGWHEPGTTLDFGFNKKAYDGLPVDLRRMLDHAAAAVQVYGLAAHNTKNAIALHRLRTEFKDKVRGAARSRHRSCAISGSWRPRSSRRNPRRRPWPGRSTRPSRSSRRWWAPGTTSPKAPTTSSSRDDHGLPWIDRPLR